MGAGGLIHRAIFALEVGLWGWTEGYWAGSLKRDFFEVGP